MIGDKRVLGLITARGGSRGLPRKNIRPLGGRPLIAWTIEAARQSAYIDRIVLSTDDAEIAEIAQEWGCDVPFTRPPELATSEARSIDVVRHALASLAQAYTYLVLLQPTSPLRSSEDIDACLRLCEERAAPACVSVTDVEMPPHWMYSIGPDGLLSPFLCDRPRLSRRQDAPSLVGLNGAVFVAQIDWLGDNDDFVGSNTVAYRMPPERSVDIDSEFDFLCADALVKRNLE